MNTSLYTYLHQSVDNVVSAVDTYYKNGVDTLFSIIDESFTVIKTGADYYFLNYLLTSVAFCMVIGLIRCLFTGKKKTPQKLNGCTEDPVLHTVLCNMAKTAFTAGLADQVIRHVDVQSLDVNTPLPYNGLTIFLSSCLSGNKGLIRHMLSRGGDIKTKTTSGDTPLYLATFAVINSGQSDYTVLEDIILAGCDVNGANIGGYTPLHRAAGGGNVQVIQLLMDYGANPYRFSVEGIYPVDIAVNNGHLEAAKLLEIRIYNPYAWDVIEPHTPPRIKLGLQSPKKSHLIESSRKYMSPRLNPLPKGKLSPRPGSNSDYRARRSHLIE